MAQKVQLPVCRTDKDIENVIRKVISRCTSFKIGKTGETIEDRGSQPDYQDDYLYIGSLYASESEELISMLENKFINMFISHPKNDNIKGGEQSQNDTMADDAESYHVYVVWR